jgi:hypothetical protein
VLRPKPFVPPTSLESGPHGAANQVVLGSQMSRDQRAVKMSSRLIVTGCALACLALFVGVVAWHERSEISIWLAPEKTPSAVSSERAKEANAKFWDAFHGGRYEQLAGVIESLTAAYLENPRDVDTTAHLGFAHIWAYGERAHLDKPAPTIADHIVLSRKYFAEAVRLAPRDQRFKGFLASLELAEGAVDGNEKLSRKGYSDLLRAVEGWPEFNLFTAGYVLSQLPFTDPIYSEAVDFQWRNVDACAGEKVDRRTARYDKYMVLETKTGPKRACWNSWFAPHNFEGFFLNMGDMLVKQGDPITAQRVYANAKLSKTYQEWPFKSVLADRIEHAPDNVVLFRGPPAGEKIRTMMISSTFSCTACHQQ